MPDGTPPDQLIPTKLADYLAVMSKAVFQTGMSWRVVEAKWAGTLEVFRDFDPQTLLELTPDDVDAIAIDTRITRNRRKVEATIANAKRLLELDEAHGTFQNYLRSHADFDSLIKDLTKNFKFLGRMGAFYMLYVVGEEVPDHTAYMASTRK
jgi:3-methyladenine DNA glycosylase Tag